MFLIKLLELENKNTHITVSVFVWSGRRDSNSRPSPWQGDALPLSHFRKLTSNAASTPKGFAATLVILALEARNVNRRFAIRGEAIFIKQKIFFYRLIFLPHTKKKKYPTSLTFRYFFSLFPDSVCLPAHSVNHKSGIMMPTRHVLLFCASFERFSDRVPPL